MEVIVILFALIMPAGVLAGFYLGFKTAGEIFAPGKPPALTPGGCRSQPRETVSDEERIAAIIAANIENFGTDIPQVEVG